MGEAEMRSEEMRILYVAMTRPEKTYSYKLCKEFARNTEKWQETDRQGENACLPLI